MTIPLGGISITTWLIGAVVVAALAAAGVQTLRLSTATARLGELQARVEAAEAQQRERVRMAEAAAAAAITQEKARALRQARALRADAAAVRTELDRMRERARILAGFEGGPGSARAAGGSAAAAGPGLVLADVLGRVGGAAEVYAATADQRGAAGQSCERSYQALKTACEAAMGGAD